MPLFGDRACMVDRYDVRLLLDDTSLPELLQVTPQPWELEEGGGYVEVLEPESRALGCSEANLHRERYLDLDYTQEHVLERPYGGLVAVAAPRRDDEQHMAWHHDSRGRSGGEGKTHGVGPAEWQHDSRGGTGSAAA